MHIARGQSRELFSAIRQPLALRHPRLADDRGADDNMLRDRAHRPCPDAWRAPPCPDVVRRQSLRRRRIISRGEIRLSDAALDWMCEQALSVPDGLRTGPIFADGVKMPQYGDAGAVLNIYPPPTACSTARSPECATPWMPWRPSCRNGAGSGATSPPRTGKRISAR